jgi:hypothetical protein
MVTIVIHDLCESTTLDSETMKVVTGGILMVPADNGFPKLPFPIEEYFPKLPFPYPGNGPLDPRLL